MCLMIGIVSMEKGDIANENARKKNVQSRSCVKLAMNMILMKPMSPFSLDTISIIKHIEDLINLLQSMIQSKTGYNADNTNFIVNPMHLNMEIDLNMNENSKVGMPIVTSIASEQEKKDDNKSKELDLLDDYSGDLLLKNIISQVLKASIKDAKTQKST
ncbi:hypothetical protein RFI_40230 [Reticulomyxa filosa]|uniref:Uncharacterized protein n=1 Tax=Reticulomyxa filosa TaxID=46433 RepID=X6L8D2_RETFI|nr:hypothetical protein RFI_40230 [Reticulomyxa filosa]|eukprot:ETN97301.1 hypothetical protein RFI_40230 [Reticulomyxa filosa]